MPNTREKLIELLKWDSCEHPYTCDPKCKYFHEDEDCHALRYADHLIANGVTVLPCKTGDTIFEADPEHGVVKHEVYEICIVYKTTAIDDKGETWDDFYTSEDIDAAYKTRGEAKAALQSRRKEDAEC